MGNTKEVVTSLFVIIGVPALLALGVTFLVGEFLKFKSQLKEQPVSSVRQEAAPAPANPPAKQPPALPLELEQSEGFFPADYTLPDMFYVNGNKLFNIYNDASHSCIFDKNPTCRQENLLDGSFIEISRTPLGGFVMTRRADLSGKDLRRIGITPSEKIDFLFMDGKVYFFSEQDGTLEQLTVVSDAEKMKGDVIHFNPSGAQTDCQCADGTVSCCGREEYDFSGKPNTYCQMFPSDPVLCSPAVLAAETVQ